MKVGELNPSARGGWLAPGEDGGQPPPIQEPEQTGYRYGSGEAELGRAARHAECDPEAGRPEEGREWRMTRHMVVVERGATSWGAHVPDLPGCVAVGETRAEVLRLIREAIEFHVDGLKQDGLPVPPPSSAGEFVEVGAR